MPNLEGKNTKRQNQNKEKKSEDPKKAGAAKGMMGWLKENWKKSAILMGTGAVMGTAMGQDGNVARQGDREFVDSSKNKVEYVAPKKRLKRIEKNVAGFGEKEQQYYSEAVEGRIQDRILIRKDIPNKGVWTTAEKAFNSSVFYHEVERGRGKHWEWTKKEKLEQGGTLYKTEDELNTEKVLDPNTEKMVSKHNPKGVDLKIDGKFYPVALMDDEYIAPLVAETVLLEDVLEGRGYVKEKKGELMIFGKVIKEDGTVCYTIKNQYACGNPVMDNEAIKAP